MAVGVCVIDRFSVNRCVVRAVEVPYDCFVCENCLSIKRQDGKFRGFAESFIESSAYMNYQIPNQMNAALNRVQITLDELLRWWPD